VIDDLSVATAGELLRAMDQRQLSAVELTQHFLERILAENPRVNAVLAVDPTALDQARAADTTRRQGQPGALCGLPVLVKDNIAVTGMPTTAGSNALSRSRPIDAPLVGRLRAAGAIVLGKTNLSEWANFRSERSTSGWSAVGGQTRNPHVLDRSPSGSSSGSAVAAAAAFAPLTIGTETDGSILSPAGTCGAVGFKPGLGSIPGAGIVPISSEQDVAGPITRTVAEAAALFAVLSATGLDALDGQSLRAARIGVWTPNDLPSSCAETLDVASEALIELGATLHPVHLPTAELAAAQLPALLTEFRHEINRYLHSAPDTEAGNLAELIEFNTADPTELSLFDQGNLEAALASPHNASASRVRATSIARALIDSALRTSQLDALVTITNGPAGLIDYSVGDVLSVSTTTPAAVAGYPSITVPSGHAGALPIGLTFIGARGTESRILAYAYAYEQATQTRRAPGFLATID
jgi:amidase